MDKTRDQKGQATIGELLLKILRGFAESSRDHPKKVAAEKANLVNYILKGVADPAMSRVIPRRAANAVIDHGFSRQELEYIVEATRRKRLEGTIHTSPGAYFLHRIRRACNLRGIPWS